MTASGRRAPSPRRDEPDFTAAAVASSTPTCAARGQAPHGDRPRARRPLCRRLDRHAPPDSTCPGAPPPRLGDALPRADPTEHHGAVDAQEPAPHRDRAAVATPAVAPVTLGRPKHERVLSAPLLDVGHVPRTPRLGPWRRLRGLDLGGDDLLGQRIVIPVGGEPISEVDHEIFFVGVIARPAKQHVGTVAPGLPWVKSPRCSVEQPGPGSSSPPRRALRHRFGQAVAPRRWRTDPSSSGCWVTAVSGHAAGDQPQAL